MGSKRLGRNVLTSLEESLIRISFVSVEMQVGDSH